MTTSHWLRKHTFSTPDITTDVLIVGGGYVGLSTAYWLTEMRPDLKITVLERIHCGAGASGRNAGFLTKGSASFFKSLTSKWGHDRAQSIYRFAEESLDLVHQHILKASPEIKFERSSSMTLFQSEKQYQEWTTKDFSPGEFRFEWREQEKLPQPLQTKFFGAFENAPEYKINPVQLLDSIKKLLEARKVQIIENVSAFELTPDGVQTEVNTIKAKQTILALNGYFPQFNALFRDVIVPRRAQMLAVEIEEEFNCPALHYDPPERVYWRKAQDKVLVIGGKRLLDEQGETGDFEKISPVIQRGLEQYLKEQLNLKYKVIHRWSGTMGFTEHELPLISKVAAPNETFIVGGFSGHGMGLGFRSAMDVAELVTGLKQESFFSPFKKVDFKL
ncbi:NAD(P)/FAD-dependent oxidoreductase [Peredibacter starrii]|uniref:FAD-binding oxidoreductase n=1 Tax=Peredibacter starrii TaxID=28202 RepID=A0AAX4HRW1_9BACT|nr:FAD-binding oxidoreductase [Peredibacter starrii]WPU66029.1 FAD-binding oxidoreductase [Peredibacter starrii]